MTTYDPAICERLAVDGKTHGESLRAEFPKCLCNGAAGCEDWCPCAPIAAAFSAASSWAEANLAAMADQLEAAKREIAVARGTIDSGNEAFRQLRDQWGAERDALRAEVEKMRPVVDAAERYRDGGPVGAGIVAAVDAYRSKP